MHIRNAFNELLIIRPLQVIIRQMRRVRQLKKSQHFIRSVQAQSREIISSIYASTLESDQLEFSQGQDFWTITPQNLKIEDKHPTVNHQEPLKHLLPLLGHLTKEKIIDTCSFIFFDNNSLHTVTQEGHIKIHKNKKQKSKLRYWLSHIHFQKLRKELTEQLMTSSDGSDGHREVIHFDEEKQYMPLAFSAKKEATTLIRQIKISSEAIYSKQGDLERQPFCIGYFNNGAEQLFSFTEILSFIEYPFNLEEISYFRIIPFQTVGTPTFKSIYSKTSLTNRKRQLIEKYKRVSRKQDRYRIVKEELDEMKSSKIENKQFDALAELLLLKMVSFLEVSQFIQVQDLSVQWLIDQSGNAKLSNCFKYHYSSLNNFRTQDGLVTLFEKSCMEKSLTLTNSQETQKSFRVKKMKSEEKNTKEITKKNSLLTCRKRANRSEMLSETLSSFRKKTKSSICQKRFTKN